MPRRNKINKRRNKKRNKKRSTRSNNQKQKPNFQQTNKNDTNDEKKYDLNDEKKYDLNDTTYLMSLAQKTNFQCDLAVHHLWKDKNKKTTIIKWIKYKFEKSRYTTISFHFLDAINIIFPENTNLNVLIKDLQSTNSLIVAYVINQVIYETEKWQIEHIKKYIEAFITFYIKNCQ